MREGDRERGVWRTVLFYLRWCRPAVLRGRSSKGRMFQSPPSLLLPKLKPLRVCCWVGNKRWKALEPGASSAHGRRDIMMHPPHAYPCHCTWCFMENCPADVLEKTGCGMRAIALTAVMSNWYATSVVLRMEEAITCVWVGSTVFAASTSRF